MTYNPKPTYPVNTTVQETRSAVPPPAVTPATVAAAAKVQADRDRSVEADARKRADSEEARVAHTAAIPTPADVHKSSADLTASLVQVKVEVEGAIARIDGSITAGNTTEYPAMCANLQRLKRDLDAISLTAKNERP